MAVGAQLITPYPSGRIFRSPFPGSKLPGYVHLVPTGQGAHWTGQSVRHSPRSETLPGFTESEMNWDIFRH
jgi:hypothetical protein